MAAAPAKAEALCWRCGRKLFEAERPLRAAATGVVINEPCRRCHAMNRVEVDKLQAST